MESNGFFDGAEISERKLVVDYILDKYGKYKKLIHSTFAKRGPFNINICCSEKQCCFKIKCDKKNRLSNQQYFVFDTVNSNLHHGIIDGSNNIIGICTSTKSITTV